MKRAVLTAASLALLVGCGDDAAQVLVDVKTDLVPGLELFAVRVELAHHSLASGDATVEESREMVVSPTGDFLRGVRVAEIDGVKTGTIHLRVSLLDDRGTAILVRLVTVQIEGSYAITVVMTRNCRDVVCPVPGGDPELSTCAAGACVSPECTAANPAGCGGIEPCENDADCAVTVACARGLCVDGQCFAAGDSALCATNEVCAPDVGCVLRPGADGGPECPPSETTCADGLDDDCDGLLDCADPDCTGQACDDGSVCTETDVCTDGRVCAGTAIDCDDGNPCTTDTCDAAAGCASVNNTDACDDGFWCNGPDSCMDGACAVHGDPPCADFCNESAMRCDACASDADCGGVTYGTWSACDYAATCDEAAMQTRPVMTPRCNAGTCTVDVTSESQACARDTDGTSCGSTTYGAWGSCNYTNACDENATQSRTVTMRRCSGGSCANQNSTDSRGCSRSRPNGYNCGASMWLVCCSGNCTDLRGSNRHCGACGVDCTTEGMTCQSAGSGRWACGDCNTNAQCQRLLNGAATCYNIADGATDFCQCQCSGGASLCTGAGCGANFQCHDVSGHNYCSP